MALFLRRPVATRSLLSLSLQRCRRGCGDLVGATTTTSAPSSFSGNTFFCRPIGTSGFPVTVAGVDSEALFLPFLLLPYRGFAKGKKSRDDSAGDTIQAISDIGPSVKSSTTTQMDAAIVALARELSKIRTGRASAGMLDHILVELEDAKVALNRVAAVSVIDSKTLSVMPYDCDSLKAVERAIVASPLGINPSIDGQRILAIIPPLTKENIQVLCKVVAKSAEDMKQSIRRARQKALDTIKKNASSMSKDDVKKLEKEIEDLTKRFIKSADEMCKAKEKEITSN